MTPLLKEDKNTVQGQQPTSPASPSPSTMSDIVITGYETHDVRFPTSLTGDGTDAMWVEFLVPTPAEGMGRDGRTHDPAFWIYTGTLIATIHPRMLS